MVAPLGGIAIGGIAVGGVAIGGIAVGGVAIEGVAVGDFPPIDGFPPIEGVPMEEIPSVGKALESEFLGRFPLEGGLEKAFVLPIICYLYLLWRLC